MNHATSRNGDDKYAQLVAQYHFDLTTRGVEDVDADSVEQRCIERLVAPPPS